MLIDEWSGGDQKPIKKNSMSNYYDTLMKDVRFVEGLNACMNCGVCTAICPAAAFYDYDPRKIVIAVQTKDDDEIEKLLKSETIWYCGECLSCKTRCPRGNTPCIHCNGSQGLVPATRLFHRIGKRSPAVR